MKRLTPCALTNSSQVKIILSTISYDQSSQYELTSNLWLEGALQRTEGSWMWKQRRHAWHRWRVGGIELQYKVYKILCFQSTALLWSHHSQTTFTNVSQSPNNVYIVISFIHSQSKLRSQNKWTLTLECLKKGLSSLGAYLSNWKRKKRERKTQIKNISTKSKASVTKNIRVFTEVCLHSQIKNRWSSNKLHPSNKTITQ